jgi:hypothetical protein
MGAGSDGELDAIDGGRRTDDIMAISDQVYSQATLLRFILICKKTSAPRVGAPEPPAAQTPRLGDASNHAGQQAPFPIAQSAMRLSRSAAKAWSSGVPLPSRATYTSTPT